MRLPLKIRVFLAFFILCALFAQTALWAENGGGQLDVTTAQAAPQPDTAETGKEKVQNAIEADAQATAKELENGLKNLENGLKNPGGGNENQGKSEKSRGNNQNNGNIEHGNEIIFNNPLQEKAKEVENNTNLFVRLGIALAIVVFQIFLIWLTFYFTQKLIIKTEDFGKKKFKAVKIKNVTLLAPKQMIQIALFLIKVLRLLLIVLELIIIVPVIFSLFESTKNLAALLFGYILTPFKNFFFGFISYIPNLITIVIILIITKYILRGLKFFAAQIEIKKLVIPGFFPEWAVPTFNIMRVIVIAFTVVFIYPNLPDSDSDIFKGVSVLVGVLFSIGSSSIIGNLISGIVMTYMRPFSEGDRITINNITGFVLERGPMVTRLRTDKNEIVSFPNQMIMNNSITNYSFSSQPQTALDGLIMHADVTMGYDVPWQKVHEILIKAALMTKFTEQTPPPFVNQLKLDDFYCWYEINVHTKKPELLPTIYTELYKNIQNGFSENGISLYAPHYEVFHQKTDKS